MDFEKMLQKGHSKAQTNAIASYIGINKKRFKVLVKVYLEGSFLITQRASRPLSICVDLEPHLIDPHLKKILDY